MRSPTRSITIALIGALAAAAALAGAPSALASQQALTTTTVASSANPAVVGQQVTYTAVVTSSGPSLLYGTVTFWSNGTTIANCGPRPVNFKPSPATVTCVVPGYTQPGSAQITASYKGDIFNAPSTSWPLTEQVK